jgi:cytochrome c oxidase assembly protein subunit 15
VLFNVIIFYLNYKRNYGFNLPQIIMAVILVEVLSGIILSYLAFPAAMQPIHLLFSFIIISLQISLLLKLKKP